MPDGADAVPYDPDFYFERAAEGSYAVVGSIELVDQSGFAQVKVNDQGTLVVLDHDANHQDRFKLHPLGRPMQSINSTFFDLNNRGDYLYRTDHNRDTLILCDAHGNTLQRYPRDMHEYDSYELF